MRADRPRGLRAAIVVLAIGVSSFTGIPSAWTSSACAQSGITVFASSVSGRSDQPIELQFELVYSGNLEGFQLAFSHDPGVTLLEFSTDLDATTELGLETATGGALTVVLADPIPATSQPILCATATFVCDNPIPSTGSPQAFGIQFVNGVQGTPPVVNNVTIDGQMVSPLTVDAQLVCEPTPPEQVTEYRLARNSLFPTVDASDLVPPVARPGDIFDIGLYYARTLAPGELFPGPPIEDIAGFQFVLCFPEILQFLDFHSDDTAISPVGVEFIATQVDPVERPIEIPCDPEVVPLAPGATPNVLATTGRDILIGVLLDAVPPFDNQLAPSSATPTQYLLAGRVTAELSSSFVFPVDPVTGVESEEELLPIGFCLEPGEIDDDQQDAPTVENLFVKEFSSVSDLLLTPTKIIVTPGVDFIRGDCNDDGSVNLADAVAVLSGVVKLLVAQDPEGIVDCVEACNADGLTPTGGSQPISLNDAVLILEVALGLDLSASNSTISMPAVNAGCGGFVGQLLGDCVVFDSCP